jgi:drug/metabolite transporter (DMT)-like permease
MQILFFSCLLALPLILVYAIASDPHQALRPRYPALTLLRAAITVGNSFLVIYAFGALPLAQAYAIFFTMPLFIALLAVPFLGERLDIVIAGAIIVGLAGVLVALQPGTMPLEWAHLAALGGALSGAVNSLLIRKTRDESYLVLVLYPMAAQLAVAAAVMPFVYIPMQGRDLAVTGIQVVAGVTGTVAIIAAYRRANAATVAPMQYSQIIWATILGFFIFGERPGLATLVGITLIIAAGLAVAMRKGD